jgi:ABC-type transporter Mla subunit MlaD
VSSARNRPKDLFLGLLFFAFLISMVIITTQLRNFPGVGSRAYLPVLFETVYGIKKEDRVLVYGTTFGRVLRVDPISFETWRETGRDLAADNGLQEPFEPHVLVVLELDYPLELREGYAIYAEDSNLLGGKIVTIDPGRPERDVAGVGSEERSYDASDVEVLRSVKWIGKRRPHPITSIGELVETNQTDFREIVKNLREATDLANDKDKSIIGLLLADADARNRVSSILEEAERFSKSLNDEGSLLHDLTHESQLGRDVRQIATDVKDASAGLKNPETLIGSMLVADSPIKRDFDAITADVRNVTAKLNRSDSLAGKLFDEGENSLGKRAQDLVDDVAQMVSDGKGNQDSLLYNVFYGDMGKNARELFAKLENAAEKIETGIIDPIKNREGILGYVISDPEAKKKFERLITATLGIVEDAREAAPVTSLGSFIFGGF